jgi:hypothetical protein
MGFQEVDWQEYYPNAREAIRPNMPEASGRSVTMTCFLMLIMLVVV